MVALTHTMMTEAILESLLVDTFNQPSDGPLARSLQEGEYLTILDVVGMTDKDINTLVHTIPAKGDLTVAVAPPCPQRNLLRILQHYIRYCVEICEPIDITGDWKDVTRNKFDTYHVGPYYLSTILTERPTAPSGGAAPSAYRCDLVQEFRRGIRRDS